ncbi:quercetin 2,3-dioxygenase [Actinomycetospora straminea]|uniref:Cupin type-2 domain-containing protein n=1 Tax=Actinomycetospora straminea TaxID=663607 RepID=A0ABP9FBY4_9PSEU|nr:quercetin 2,3-dioxygenase [Actinomycetospora straminea]MDD7936585.1 quercetin 2,3-dioxygenase [Actinomycetospora straminea]
MLGAVPTAFTERRAMSHPTAVQPYRLRADEGEALSFLGNLVTVKAGSAQTGGRLSVVEILHPPGFGPPLHRHDDEDEAFYVLDGAAQFRCDGEALDVGAGDFVFLPAGRPHTFLVGADEPLRALQMTTPGGFEGFVAEVGAPAVRRGLPDPATVDPAVLGAAAARYGIEVLGPPPTA